MKKRGRRGVPVGYKIPGWSYHGRWKERKVAPRRWKFHFQATKRRKSKGYGGHPKGRRITWDIKAKQKVVKTNKGEYQTSMRGTKKLIKVR